MGHSCAKLHYWPSLIVESINKDDKENQSPFPCPSHEAYVRTFARGAAVYYALGYEEC